MDASPCIGTLRETALHAALKRHYAQPGDRLETAVDGFVVDIQRGDQVIEIQTHSFAKLKPKLLRLLEHYPVRVVHPIALERWIVRQDAAGHRLGRRKSPRRGAPCHLFVELVSFPELLGHPNFSLEVVLTREDEIRQTAPRTRRRWRREWRVVDRALLEVMGQVVLESPDDCLAFLPGALPTPFTNRDLALALNQPTYISQKLTYCLRQMGALTIVGKQGRALAYRPCPATASGQA